MRIDKYTLVILLICCVKVIANDWTWEITPSNPTENDTVIVKMSFYSDWSLSIESEHKIESTEITITVKVIIGNLPIAGWFGHADTLGILEPNLYKCNIFVEYYKWDMVQGSAIYLGMYDDSQSFEVKPYLDISNNPSFKIPANHILLKCYPNPSNTTVKFKYIVQEPGLIELKIYDIVGREIQTIIHESFYPGEYWINFDTKFLSSGVYYALLYKNSTCLANSTMTIIK
jgi:hypothetical protein